jgi:hypothetical protein
MLDDQEIITKRLETQRLKKQQQTDPITSPSRIFHTERYYEHAFRLRVFVHDLPPEVDKSQLQLFFSKHGKVSSTKMIYHSNTKTSQGIVNMATMHAHEDDAIAALEELRFDGRRLEVILVSDMRRERRERQRKAA